MRIELSRCQVGSGGNLELPMHAANVNQWGPMVPLWPMVRGYKAGRLSIPQYLRQYYQRLERVYRPAVRKLWTRGKLNGGTILLSCYCRDGQFCHTYYLIKWLVEHYPTGFKIHPDLVEFVDGLDWEGRCWEWKDPVRVNSYEVSWL